MSDNFINVTTLNGHIANILRAEDYLQYVSVVGEVIGFKVSGQHAYFQIKDENSQIDCSSFNCAKRYMPRNGELVLIKGKVELYAKTGRISLITSVIEPYGEGLLAMQLEALKKKLTEQGYFDEKHKRAIPTYCKRVCVLTSASGAVIRDIITTARKNNRYINIDLIDCRVQGAGAQDTIISALKTVDAMGYDAIIIARGGGSFEDLMPFNSELLVYEIFKAKTPIISAVGHETDFTLCDFVADKRAATPTAAAELVAFNQERLAMQYAEYYRRMRLSLGGKITMRFDALKSVTGRMVFVTKLRISDSAAQVARNLETAKNSCINKWTARAHSLDNITLKIQANNPIKILRQGYGKIFDNVGRHIEVTKLKVGDDFTLLGDGAKIKGNVKEITSIKLD